MPHRANLHSLLMNAPIAVCIISGADETIEFANPLFQQIVSGETLIGQSVDALGGHHLEPIIEAVNEVRRTGKGSAPLELRVNDRVYTFSVQPTPDGVVVFSFDITKEAEAQRKLEDADRAKDEFIAIVSHELRTPMTSILGWARMLAIGGLDDAIREEAIDAIERSTRAQAKLIEDLLDESRIAAGKLRLDLRSVDLHTLVDGAVAMVRPQAEVRGLTLQIEIDDDARYEVAGDPIRLQQVVINVIGNAVKFTPEGGTISITLTREEPFAVIRVRDNGRGIAPDLLPHVFDRFRQGDSNATDRQGGLGLGLAIARHLVEMHGGNIEASSEGQGKGATLTIRLPLDEPLNKAEAFVGRDAARVRNMPPLNGVRVLIIEDEVDNRRVVAAALQQCGADVECVGTAAAAFDRIDRWTPHVLVCDIALPDLDGCTFLQQLRHRPNATPALALTVFGRPGEQARIKAAGFEVFRQKPIDPVDLAHEVARLAHAVESRI